MLQEMRRAVTPEERLQQMLDQLDTKLAQHLNITAVLRLVDQLAERPEVLPQLNGYSREVFAAALLLRVNILSSDIQTTQHYLTSARRTEAERGSHYRANTVRLENLLADQMAQLMAAQQAAEEFGATTA